MTTDDEVMPIAAAASAEYHLLIFPELAMIPWTHWDTSGRVDLSPIVTPLAKMVAIIPFTRPVNSLAAGIRDDRSATGRRLSDEDSWADKVGRAVATKSGNNGSQTPPTSRTPGRRVDSSEAEGAREIAAPPGVASRGCVTVSIGASTAGTGADGDFIRATKSSNARRRSS